MLYSKPAWVFAREKKIKRKISVTAVQLQKRI